MYHIELLRKEIAWKTVYLSYYRTKRDFAQTIRRKSSDLTGRCLIFAMCTNDCIFTRKNRAKRTLTRKNRAKKCKL